MLLVYLCRWKSLLCDGVSVRAVVNHFDPENAECIDVVRDLVDIEQKCQFISHHFLCISFSIKKHGTKPFSLHEAITVVRDTYNFIMSSEKIPLIINVTFTNIFKENKGYQTIVTINNCLQKGRLNVENE